MENDALKIEIDELDLVPLNGKIIVREKEIKQIGSIIIPETSKQLRATEGVVLAVSDDAETIGVGDLVYYGRYSGIQVLRGEKLEKEYYLMAECDVLCLIEPNS